MAGMDCLCVASLSDLQEPVGTSDEEHKPAHEAKHEYFKNKKQMSGLFANILSFYHMEVSPR